MSDRYAGPAGYASTRGGSSVTSEPDKGRSRPDESASSATGRDRAHRRRIRPCNVSSSVAEPEVLIQCSQPLFVDPRKISNTSLALYSGRFVEKYIIGHGYYLFARCQQAVHAAVLPDPSIR